MTDRKWSAALFALVFAAAFAVGFVYSHVLGYMHSDAMSRVANAYYVLYSRDPHLAAIGFVWNPLPSLVNLAFLVFYPIVPALASSGLAGVLMSALFAAAAASFLFAAGRSFGLGKGTSLALALLYAFNPLMFYFGFTGLSDAPFNFFILYMTAHFLHWLDKDRPGHLVRAGLGLALAFWTRYEAVPIGVAVAAGCLIAVLFMRKTDDGAKEVDARSDERWQEGSFRRLGDRLRAAEGTGVVLLAPAVYSGLLWICFNALIMGNPLYFLNSEYSNLAQASPLASDPRFAELFGNPLKSLVLVLQKTSWFALPLLAVLLIRLAERRLLRWDTAVLLLLAAAVPALQLLLLTGGASFAWFRYFMYVFPLTVAWIPYELARAKFRKAAVSAVLAAMAASAGMHGYAISNPDIAPDEYTTITMGHYHETQRQDRAVARFLDERYPDDTILMDSSTAFTIILRTENPRRFLITSDRDFRQAMAAPWRHGVDYVLVPKPAPGMPRSILNIAYPDLYERGADWARLVHEFADGNWRLYEVVDPASGRGTG